MKKQLAKSVLIVVTSAGLFAGNATADLLNHRDPQVDVKTYTSEPSLQTVIDDAMAGYNESGLSDTAINVGTDQSTAAIWQMAEGDVSSYLISLITAGTSGSLGIYSYATGETYALATFTGDGISTGFSISTSGQLYINNEKVAGADDFGQLFGFYWYNGTYQYTEDSKNTDGASALAYKVAEGTTLYAEGLIRASNGTLVGSDQTMNLTASGNNDWILAFEDGSDNDFQDAVFYIEDMKSPIPEPTTMLLFGTGLIGLAAIARRKNS